MQEMVFKKRQSFPQSKDIKRHKISVHKKIKPYQCMECGKCFSFKTCLKRHIKTVHEGIRPFNCDECGKLSSSLCRILKQHKSLVHWKIKPFQWFLRKSNLKIHKKNIHVRQQCAKSIKQLMITLKQNFYNSFIF